MLSWMQAPLKLIDFGLAVVDGVISTAGGCVLGCIHFPDVVVLRISVVFNFLPI